MSGRKAGSMAESVSEQPGMVTARAPNGQLLHFPPRSVAGAVKPPQRCRAAEKHTDQKREEARDSPFSTAPAADILWERKQPSRIHGGRQLMYHKTSVDALLVNLKHLETERARIFPNPDGTGVEVQEAIQAGGVGKQGAPSFP